MQKRRNGQPTPLIQSLDRGLVILEAVGKSTDPVSLGELTGILGIDRSSAFRLANTLRARGFLSYPSGRKDYILGPSIWRLSRQYDWSNMLIRVSHEHLKGLASLTKETAHLAVRVGERALFIDHAAAIHVIAVTGQTGELLPLHCTAHGKALLADCDKQELKMIMGSRPLEMVTPRSVTSLTKLAKMCSEINEQGYATDDEEYLEGVRCVAAPIRAQGGAVIGSIGISAPLQRFPQERYAICGAQVRDIANQIGAALSHEAETVNQ